MLALNAVAERHIGRFVDSRHSLADEATLERLFVDVGFRDVQVLALSHDERGELAGRIAAESQQVIIKATRDGVFVLPLATNLVIAHVGHNPERRSQQVAANAEAA